MRSLLFMQLAAILLVRRSVNELENDPYPPVDPYPVVWKARVGSESVVS